MHWDHEPKMRNLFISKQGILRFMESDDSEIVHCGHEPLAVPRQTESADKSDALSKRFALAAESADDASAFGVRASSAPLSHGRLQFDGRVGSWRAPFRFFACIGTMNPLTAWSPGFSLSKPFESPEGGTPNQPRFIEWEPRPRRSSRFCNFLPGSMV
jgi:hypothetical protein